MTPLKLQVELLRAEFEATPNPITLTSGYKCPKCATPYVIHFGRHSKKFLAFHGMNPHCADGYKFICKDAASHAQALEVCREYAEGEKTL